ncbi:MAG TPA: protein kinase [Polyangiaceae bacterium]
MTEEGNPFARLTGAHEDCPASHAARCLGDDELLAFVQGLVDEDSIGALHQHVDECDTCQRLVNEAAHALDATPVNDSAGPTWNTTFQPNAMVARRYRVLRLLARGGMGDVYEAYDTALRERVAIKTVTSTACDNSQAVAYLKAEVQLARRVSHPNVCRIFDLGTHATEVSGVDIHFLVMEFVEGESLGKRLRQSGPLPIETAQTLALQLLSGLGAAHQAGILHRDFKSDNVMLRRDPSGSTTPVILDFGLAKVFNDNGRISITQHHGHSLVGTIGYMSPEQVEGASLSAASDLYAFGVVWFEMLTGRLPFEAETPAAAALARLYRSPTLPSTINSNIPPRLEALILKCLSRDRSARFASAEELIDALTAISTTPDGQSVDAGGSRRSSAPSARLTTRWIGATLASLVVAIGGFGALIARPVPRTAMIPMNEPAPSGQPRPTRESVSTSVADEPMSASSPAKTHAARSRGYRRSVRATDVSPAAATARLGIARVDAQAAAVPSVVPRPARTTPDWLPLWSRASRSELPAAPDQSQSRGGDP